MDKSKKTRVIDDKISIFGILSATKALTNPVKENLEISKEMLQIEKERLNVEKNIEKHLEAVSNAQKNFVTAMLRVAQALEYRNALKR